MADPGSVEALLWRVRAILKYADEMPSLSRDPRSRLTASEIEALWDQLDAANQCVSGVLDDLHPELRELADQEMESRRTALESHFVRDQPQTLEGLVNLLRDAVGLLNTVDIVSEWRGFEGGDAAAWEAIATAHDDLEAALHSIDPTWLAERMAEADDPDDRISLAARFEELELETEHLRGVNRAEVTLREAQEQIQRLQLEDPAVAASLLSRSRRPQQHGEELLRDLVAAGLTLEQAQVLLAFHSL